MAAFITLTARTGFRIRLMVHQIENWEPTGGGPHSTGTTVYWSRQSIQVTESPEEVDRLIADAKAAAGETPG